MSNYAKNNVVFIDTDGALSAIRGDNAIIKSILIKSQDASTAASLTIKVGGSGGLNIFKGDVATTELERYYPDLCIKCSHGSDIYFDITGTGASAFIVLA